MRPSFSTRRSGKLQNLRASPLLTALIWPRLSRRSLALAVLECMTTTCVKSQESPIILGKNPNVISP